MEDIILLGLGGHAHSVVDSIERGGKYNIVGFLDKEEICGSRFRDYYVIDTDEELQKYFLKGIKNAFVTVGYMGQVNVRSTLYQRLKDCGYKLPNIFDKTAVISENAEFEDGIFVGKNAIVNANAKIKKMCIINTGAIVEHDCIIGQFSHVAVGSVICGGVLVKEQAFIGANVTVIQGKTIGRNCIVGAGTTVIKDIHDNMTWYGIRENDRG